MRDIDCKQIAKIVSNLFQEACIYLPEDVLATIKRARESQQSPVAEDVIDRILENTGIAYEEKPLCAKTLARQ